MDRDTPNRGSFFHEIFGATPAKQPSENDLHRGTVKYCNRGKAYGFIYDNKTKSDIYFHFADTDGPNRPREGDEVLYKRVSSPRGGRARSVQVVTTREAKRYATCSYCGLLMVPRVITSRGSVDGSICPFCLQYHQLSPTGWTGVIAKLALLAFLLSLGLNAWGPSDNEAIQHRTPLPYIDQDDSRLSDLVTSQSRIGLDPP